jgi:hypothetical protein
MLLSPLRLSSASHIPPDSQTCGAPARHVAHPSDTWRTRQTRDAPVRHVAHPSDTWRIRQTRGAPVRYVAHPSDMWRTRQIRGAHQTRGAPVRHVAHTSDTWRTRQIRDVTRQKLRGSYYELACHLNLSSMSHCCEASAVQLIYYTSR